MIPAIVPAAGRSERMGRPKLILPIEGTTVIARVVSALLGGGAGPVIVVVPPADAPGAATLAEEAARAGAEVLVAADRPPDMRGSFELGFARLAEGAAATMVLLTPGDSAGITAALVAEVIARARQEPRGIVIPVVKGRRGHPVALPWHLAAAVSALPEGVGINALVALHPDEVVELLVAEPGAVDDLDTPEDYDRWVVSM